MNWIVPSFGSPNIFNNVKTSHKGQNGKIGIIGGCLQYTGAPYFAGMSSLLIGADLVTIFCTEEAAIPIKSYSPDLIVHPVLITGAEAKAEDWRTKKVIDYICEWLPRLDVLVIGPGLGRDKGILFQIELIILKARDTYNIPMVLDGDALFLIAQKPDLVSGHNNIIMTPNAMEFKRLWQTAFPSSQLPPFDIDFSDLFKLNLPQLFDEEPHLIFMENSHSIVNHTAKLSSYFGGVIILKKGLIDVISNGTYSSVCILKGMPRRVGGQGDILAGSIGIFLCWHNKNSNDRKITKSRIINFQKQKTEQKQEQCYCLLEINTPSVIDAIFYGCLVTRYAALYAFREHHRTTLTTHILSKIGDVFTKYFGI